jgi:hypothetical protein
MLKYLTKFAMDVLPSVVATILGAYIVNHYINTKSDADTPAAAVIAPAGSKAAAMPAETVKIPAPGVKAKGISERAMIEKSASEGVAEVKPSEVKPSEVKPSEVKPAEVKASDAKAAETKPADVKPSETASAPAESRRAPVPREAREKDLREKDLREKAVAKATPTPVASPAPVAEAAATEERRDANDLARAAIERLRNEGGARTQEASAPHLQEAPRTVSASPVRPLPPPINVSTPEGYNAGSSSTNPSTTASVRNDDPSRPTPPAEIPAPPPLDLRAAANDTNNRAKNVAEDMLAAAKSMFHTVLPQ